MSLWQGVKTRGPCTPGPSCAPQPRLHSSNSRTTAANNGTDSGLRRNKRARGAWPEHAGSLRVYAGLSSPGTTTVDASRTTAQATPLPRQTHLLAASRTSMATSAPPQSPGSTRTTAAALSLQSSADSSGSSEPAPTRSGNFSVTYEEEDEAQPTRLVPATGSKTLKLNMDLSLWRSRTRRIEAAMSLDKDKRRTLLKESEATLRRCLALDPTDARSYVVLGKLLQQQKRFEEARRLYAEGTTATANNSPYIWSSWGWLEFKTGNIATARKLFDAAVVVDETHACAWHKWGMLERSEGNFMRARDLWMQGIQKCRRKPQSQIAYLYNALAVMASQVGRVEEARAWFEEGTRTLEGIASVALWQAWAVLEAKQGDPTAVRYLFKRALGVNPKSRYVHLAWAMWENKQGNTSLCMQLLKRGNSLNPTDPAIYQAWAILEKKFGNYDHAAQLFEAGLKADPNHVYLWQAWACMEAERGNADRARDLFQQGVWADPNSRNTVYIFHAWGVLERRTGNPRLARELFKAALKVDPKSDSVWSTWIAMEEELGFLDKADDLRIRQAEQQWEFEVPYNFTTRPTESPLTKLVDTLARFFTARQKGNRASPPNTKRTLKDLLPEDFDNSLSAEDVMPILTPAQMPSRPLQSFEDAIMDQQLQQQQQVLQQKQQRQAQQPQLLQLGQQQQLNQGLRRPQEGRDPEALVQKPALTAVVAAAVTAPAQAERQQEVQRMQQDAIAAVRAAFADGVNDSESDVEEGKSGKWAPSSMRRQQQRSQQRLQRWQLQAQQQQQQEQQQASASPQPPQQQQQLQEALQD